MTRDGRPAGAADPATSGAEFDSFVRRAEADRDVLGLVLMGSRGFDALVDEDSDYDLLVIVVGRSSHGRRSTARGSRLGR